MVSALAILIPVVFAILLSGGFSIKGPENTSTSTSPVSLSEGGLAGVFNSLQIGNLVPGESVITSNPSGPTPTTSSGGSLPSPTQPSYTYPTPLSGIITPTRRPSISPSPTQGPSLCKGKKVAFDLLFDVSGSIGSLSTKMQKASRRLISLLDDETVVGIQEFSKYPRDVLAFNKLRVNRARAINLVGQGGRDLTYMKDGWEFARGKVASGQSAFPGYKWYVVFFSDGVPNCSNPNLYPSSSVPGSPCDGDQGDEGPNPEQDPTPVANGMKPGITIWSIGFYQYLSYLGSSNLNNAA